MPLYDYQCDDCGHIFEVMKKRGASGPDKCPDCGAADPRRAISATSFQLKGSGWYVTDYKGANPSSTANKAAPTESKSAETSETSESSSPGESSSSSDSGDPAPGSKEVA